MVDSSVSALPSGGMPPAGPQAFTGPPARADRLSIERPRPLTTVITITGEVDLATAGVVERTVLDTVAASAGHLVVIDLTGVEFLCASGVGILLAAEEQATRSGGALQVVLDEGAPAARTLRLLPDVGLTVVSTTAAALRQRRPVTADPRCTTFTAVVSSSSSGP